MDFSRHNAGSPAVRPSAQPAATDPGTVSTKRSGRGSSLSMWTRAGYAALLFATTILVVAIAGLIAFSGNKNESKLINTSKYQAVFINDGSSSGQSVYFGHITKLTSSYLILENIYYITTTASSSSATASSNYTLTKLGCQQLHDPYDLMVINLSQVAFWENLQDSGKVVTAINQFQKDNPNGPDCSQSSNSVGTSTSTTQNATTQSGSTGNATTKQ